MFGSEVMLLSPHVGVLGQAKAMTND